MVRMRIYEIEKTMEKLRAINIKGIFEYIQYKVHAHSYRPNQNGPN